jgi:hypothetical protein
VKRRNDGRAKKRTPELPGALVAGETQRTKPSKKRMDYYWLVVSTPLKNMKVSRGYYSQCMEKKQFQTTNQVINKHPKTIQTNVAPLINLLGNLTLLIQIPSYKTMATHSVT